MHLDAMTEQSLRGLEVNGAFGDQIEEIDPELIDIIDSRLGRWQLPEWKETCPPYLWSTSNPRGHDAVYFRYHPNIVKYDRIDYFDEWDTEQFERLKEMGIEVDPKYISPSIAAYSTNKAYFFGSTLINLPKLNEIEPTYVRNLLRKPESWKKQWIYGNRDFFEGSVHPNFRESIHVYDPAKFDPLEGRRIRRIMGWFDYGLSHPTVLLLTAHDDEGYIWVFHEYGAPNRTIEQHSHEIKRLQTRYNPEALFADPQVFQQMTRDRKVMTKSIAEEYAQYGIGFVKADNNEDTSIQKIEELLHVDDRRLNPVTRQLGSPRLFFSRACPHTIAQIQQQRWEELRNPLTGEKEFAEKRDSGVPDDYYDCLSGDTLVDTEWGPYRISNLVGTQGKVWSPFGYVGYRDCKKYKTDSETVSVEFHDGRSVICTPDHLFLTPDGWVEARDLTGKSVCNTLPIWSEYLALPGRNFSASATSSPVEDISVETGNPYTGPFGFTSMALFPKGITSTIKMGIRPTIKSIISNAYRQAHTLVSTIRESRTRRQSEPREKPLGFGMEAKRALSGIKNTIRNLFFPHTSAMCLSSVSSVGGSFWLPVLAKKETSSVPTTASLCGAGNKESTSNREHVSAGTSFPLTNTTPPGSVPRNAATVLAVRPAPNQDTYCLTVDNPLHAFTVSTGLVVHNCARYMANSKYLDYSPFSGTIRVPSFDSQPKRQDMKVPMRGYR